MEVLHWNDDYGDHITMTRVLRPSLFIPNSPFGAGFSYHMRLEWKFVAPKINMAERDLGDKFVICNLHADPEGQCHGLITLYMDAEEK